MESELTDVKGRYEWAEKDSERGLKSLERLPEEEVFCMLELEGGKWGFPRTDVEKGEGLDEAVKRGLTGVEGSLGGEGLDSWIVTRKPVGLLVEGESRVSRSVSVMDTHTDVEQSFFLRSHILAGSLYPQVSLIRTGHGSPGQKSRRN